MAWAVRRDQRASARTARAHSPPRRPFRAPGEYTGQNTPHEDKPERVCCHVCPRKCSESTGKCFHKCYKVCGSACKVEAHEGECEIGKDCEMTEKTGGCDKPAEPAATGATGVESKVVDVTEPEVVKHHGHAEATGPAATGVEGVHCGAGTGKPCEEPEVITEDDIETAEVAEDEAAEETDRKGGEQRSLRA